VVCVWEVARMSNSEDYRRHAAFCLHAGEIMSDPAARLALVDIAHAWHDLADQAERNSKLDLVYEPPLSLPDKD
jgi:hypothetical protein